MKKKLIVAVIIIVALVGAGYGAVRWGVDFVFDKFVLKSALSSIAEKSEETKPVASLPEKNEEKKEPEETDISEGSEKKHLTKTEIISRVMRNSKLTYKMASMVSYEDKKRVLSIIMSNFTADELTEIAKNVRQGLTADYKSQMIAEAQSRLSGAQWQECLNIAYKYIEQIRPFVE